MESEPNLNQLHPAPHRRSPLGYLNYMAASRSLRNALTRENLIESVKTMIWVVPLTLLIWVYAEREQIVYPNFPNANNVAVKISSSNPLRYVEPSGNPQPTLNLKLTGPQEAIEKVKDQLMGQAIPIDIGLMDVGDKQPINIVDHIQNLPVFKSNGVTVVDSQPVEILVNVDDRMRLDVPVEVAPSDLANLSQTRFDPPTLSVQGPTKLLSSKPHVYADLSLVAKNPGEQPAQSVPVRLAVADARISISPAKVNATVVVKASDIRFTVSSVPIVVSIDPATLKNFDVTSVNLGDVTIGKTEFIGPPEQIEAIMNLQFKPRAILEILPDDAVRQEPKKLRYDLPPGVHVNADNEARKVEFKLTPRNSGG